MQTWKTGHQHRTSLNRRLELDVSTWEDFAACFRRHDIYQPKHGWQYLSVRATNSEAAFAEPSLKWVWQKTFGTGSDLCMGDVIEPAEVPIMRTVNTQDDGELDRR